MILIAMYIQITQNDNKWSLFCALLNTFVANGRVVHRNEPKYNKVLKHIMVLESYVYQKGI